MVQTFGDGRCFFRCLAASLYKELREAYRSEYGLIISEDLVQSEMHKADTLRRVIASLLFQEEQLLSRMARDIPFLLDNTFSTKFASIKERAKSMSRVGTFAGNLEIIAAAFLLKTQIHIYRRESDGSNFKLIAKLPIDNFSAREPILLEYQEDSEEQSGHFNLLIASKESVSDMEFPISVAIEEILQIHEDNQKEIVQFEDMFNQFRSTVSNSNDCQQIHQPSDKPLTSSTSSISNAHGEGGKECPQSDTSASVASVLSNPEPVLNDVEMKTSNKFESTKHTKLNVFNHSRRNGRHYVSCIACCKFPDIVKVLSKKSQVPPIALQSGVIFRNETVEQHLQQAYHIESAKAFRLSTLPPLETAPESVMGKAISKANETLANKIGSLLVHTYGDAKKLTLSAFSFPARVVVSKVASSFSWNSKKVMKEHDIDFQYLTPASHKEFLQCIVESHRSILAKKLTTDVLALSIRCDGSVDRTQIDKMYVMAKIVTKNGTEEQYFLGASEPSSRGAKGVLEAVEEACRETVGSDAANHIFLHASSLVTDGASVNTGERSGLWALFRSKMREHNPECTVPLLTIWCGVHRSNLAWKSTSKSVTEIEQIFQSLVGLTSYFHNSGIRSRELRQIAQDKKCSLLSLPKLFEVRWTEFSFSLMNAVLVSWHALVLFMK